MALKTNGLKAKSPPTEASAGGIEIRAGLLSVGTSADAQGKFEATRLRSRVTKRRRDVGEKHDGRFHR